MAEYLWQKKGAFWIQIIIHLWVIEGQRSLVFYCPKQADSINTGNSISQVRHLHCVWSGHLTTPHLMIIIHTWSETFVAGQRKQWNMLWYGGTHQHRIFHHSVKLALGIIFSKKYIWQFKNSWKCYGNSRSVEYKLSLPCAICHFVHSESASCNLLTRTILLIFTE